MRACGPFPLLRKYNRPLRERVRLAARNYVLSITKSNFVIAVEKGNPRVTSQGSVHAYLLGKAMFIYKWKNHFSEMKGDVGMSLHKKEREQEDA